MYREEDDDEERVDETEDDAGTPKGASRRLEQALECLTCVPVVGIVQRSDEKFWEKKVFELFMRSLGSTEQQQQEQQQQGEEKKGGEEEEEEEVNEMDDLALFVRKGEHTYFVRRRSSGQDVLLKRAEKEGVDWQESFVLNMVMQQLVFELTVYVCRRSADGRQYATLNQTTTRVYPSTVRVNVKSMTRKSTKQAKEDSYPVMYFTMYDFDDVFRNMLLGPDLVLCVDLSVSTARSAFLGVPMAQAFAPARTISVFCGAIDYAKIDTAFTKQGGGFLSRVASVFAPGSRRRDGGTAPGESPDSKFVTVNGPRNVGTVQFCFNRHTVANSTTPSPSPEAAADTATKQKKRGGKDSDHHTEYQCMPYYLSLDIHEIVRAIVKKADI